MKRVKRWYKQFPEHADRKWFPAALGLIALADYFLFIIPLDVIVVASILLIRKKWLKFAFWASLGSALGAGLLAYLVSSQGIELIHQYTPHALDGHFARLSEQWLHRYGEWALLVIAILPIAQHPIVIIAGLVKIPVFTIVTALFIGRMLKYTLYTWLSLRLQNVLAHLLGRHP